MNPLCMGGGRRTIYFSCHIEGLQVPGGDSERQLSFPALLEASEFIFLSYWDEMEAFLMSRMAVEAVLVPACSRAGRAGTSPLLLYGKSSSQQDGHLIYLPIETPP